MKRILRKTLGVIMVALAVLITIMYIDSWIGYDATGEDVMFWVSEGFLVLFNILTYVGGLLMILDK